MIWGDNPWEDFLIAGITPEEACARSREYANKALEIDKNLAEAHKKQFYGNTKLSAMKTWLMNTTNA